MIITRNDNLQEEAIKDHEEKKKEYEEALDANKKDAEDIQKGHGETGKKVSNKQLKAMKLSEALFDEARYSDGQSGEWWYFTKHGVQPGSIPKDLNVIQIKDTPEGTYFSLDGILNTSELNQYDIKEKTPPEDILNESAGNPSFNSELFNAIENTIYLFNDKGITRQDVELGLDFVITKLFDNNIIEDILD